MSTLIPSNSGSYEDNLKELERLRAELAQADGLKAHHELCRLEAGAPDDDVLLESIKAMKEQLAAAKADADQWKRQLAQATVAIETPNPVVPTRPEKCPQCGAPVIQTNLGGGRTDDYCEECGWPDENRPETMVPREDAEAMAVALDRIACSHHPKLVNCEVAWQEVSGFAASTLAAYRANHGAPDAGKEATWQTGTPPHSNPGTSADYFLCIPLYSDVPLVLIFLHEEKHWTQGGGDTQAVRCWMPIPSAPYGKDAK